MTFSQALIFQAARFTFTQVSTHGHSGRFLKTFTVYTCTHIIDVECLDAIYCLFRSYVLRKLQV